MSNVSNRHTVTPFISGESKPLSGQRLAKVGYKKTKDQPNPPASICVSVPHLNPQDITDNLKALLPHIGNMLETAQDGIIRSLYESAQYSLDVVTDDDISVVQCIAFLEAESTGNRLTGDAIKAWFKQNVEENLTVFIAEKLGFSEITEDNLKTVMKHVNTYCEIIAMLAGGKTVLETKQRQSVRVAIGLATSDDAMSARLLARLDSMEKKTREELIDLL